MILHRIDNRILDIQGSRITKVCSSGCNGGAFIEFNDLSFVVKEAVNQVKILMKLEKESRQLTLNL